MYWDSFDCEIQCEEIYEGLEKVTDIDWLEHTTEYEKEENCLFE